MKVKIILLLIAIGSSGCTTNQKFDCPISGGIRCQSMSEIDKLIDGGHLDQTRQIKSKPFIKCSRVVPHKGKNIRHFQLRMREDVVQIWIAPYVSKEEIYHYPSMLSMVIKPSQWNSAIKE